MIKPFMMLVLCSILLVGCKQQGPEPAGSENAQRSAADQVPKTLEDAREDMVGNWVVDVLTSKAPGLKDAAKENAEFSVVVDPNGERMLYRDGQLAEKGVLSIKTVKANGVVEGVFTLEQSKSELGVSVELRGENEMVWTFDGGKRSEVLRRQQMQPEER